ncbi:unnamed protein product [Tetraodon nigroviridis]|uniref:(spotted green pufferfish) hypothetical protein n=1 Tax=Tetraodon nigroviridis TaxID=99883 RepID=Q4T4N9_TETNG|nr:unnamed protein product [Tetraodon nigroviridis]
MYLPGAWTLGVLVVLVGGQVRASSAERSGAGPSAAAARSRAQGRGSKSSESRRGKFLIHEEKDTGMQCRWVAHDVPDAVRLSVECENPQARVRGGVTDLQCEYTGKPQLCPGYQSSPEGFWKQVSRAFRKLQGKVCYDVRALVRTGMCKSAPRGALFKLDVDSSVVSAQSGGETPRPGTPAPAACAEQARRKAQERCDSSWVSLCALFFSMLEGDC